MSVETTKKRGNKQNTKISSAYKIINLCHSNINKLLRSSKHTISNAGETMEPCVTPKI